MTFDPSGFECRRRMLEAHTLKQERPTMGRDTEATTSSRVGRPAIVTPTTRVNVAFPLSKITVQEPSDELVAVVEIVERLASLLADHLEEPEVATLAQDAAGLLDRVRPRG